MSGTKDKISGKAKQAVGRMKDDKGLQAKGKVEETKGAVKKALDN